MNRILAAILLVTCITGVAYSAGGVKKKKIPEQDYGNITIDINSNKAGINPVLFEHWVHRKHFTCRVCHVDLGFSMKANDGSIRAADNMKGYYCGACHNGKFTQKSGAKLFAACSDKVDKSDQKRCARCHNLDKSAADRDIKREQREKEFKAFAEGMPRERGGNGINWEQAENAGLIQLTDYIEGISSKRSTMPIQKDFSLGAKVDGIPEIIFSHKKHTVWNGCEVCHPEIFVGVKKGVEKYSMIDIFAGKYCGACHDKVAFPQKDCSRCHTKAVH